MKRCFLLLLLWLPLQAQTRVLTLGDAVDLALQQNPRLSIARLEENKAARAVDIARDPFVPKAYIGSGLAYSGGFPMSIEGATPSIVQAGLSRFLLNREQAHRLAAAREEARGASLAASQVREQVALQAALAFLQAERMARTAECLRRQQEAQIRIASILSARAAEGRLLPLEAKRAELELARLQHRLHQAEAGLKSALENLSAQLGLDPGVPLQVALQERTPLTLPEDEEAAVRAALEQSKYLRQLESTLTARQLQVNAEKAAGLPRIDLIAQYSLLGRFNNYEDFFNKFQRHNGQLGLAIQIPLFSSPAVDARVAQATAELSRARIELREARNQVILQARQLFREVQQASSARQLARLDLELAREQVAVTLARYEEGRASLLDLEQARLAEEEKWLVYWEATYELEAAQFRLLGHTGQLLAALR